MDDNFEIELKCLGGKPIKINGDIDIYKVSIDEICDIGYMRYDYVLRTLCMSNKKINESLKKDDVDVYTYVISLLYLAVTEKNEENIEMFYDIMSVLKCIFRADVKFDVDNKQFIIDGTNILSRRNYYNFIKIIKIRNCLDDIESENDNPDSERTRQLLERRKQLREKVRKTKSENEDGDCLNIMDLISIYAESTHMKLEDVFQYDIYQFNNQFNRLKIFKDYDVNIRALLAGAKKEDVNLTHWLTKINKNE